MAETEMTGVGCWVLVKPFKTRTAYRMPHAARRTPQQ